MRKIVSLAEMKTYLGINNTDDDVWLTMQLELITETIELYCRRIFNATNFIQTFYSTDYPVSGQIMLSQYPVISLTSIVEGVSPALAADTYTIHKPTGIIRRRTSGFFFGQSVTAIAYRAGFEDAEMPLTLKSSVYDLVSERYNKRKSGVNLSFGSDVQRVSIPGAISIDFDYSLNNNDRQNSFGLILGSQLNVLDFFRSERAIVGSSKLEYNEVSP